MTASGEQNLAPCTGHTTLYMYPGSTRQVYVWVQDNVGSQDLQTYQLIFPWQASPDDLASGELAYLDNNQGKGGGDSIFLDIGNPDWAYANSVCDFPTFYNETEGSIFGLFYDNVVEACAVNLANDGANAGAIHYLAEFSLVASRDAAGEFQLPFNLVPSDPPLSILIAVGVEEFVVNEYQPLTVVVNDQCASHAECADVDSDGIRDANCVWWECNNGTCLGTDTVFADVGGPFGLCSPDRTADANDHFHVLNCFSNANTNGNPGYPCEAASPQAFNVDAGGSSGSCLPDGVCDGNDAFHVLNAFGDTTTCACGSGPAPTAPPRRKARQ
jgi:hypothetical protein